VPTPIAADMNGEPVQLRAVALAAGGAVVLHVTEEYRGLAVVIDVAEVRRLLYQLSCAHVHALQLATELATDPAEEVLAHA
jgi:hypothetical protein